MKSQYEKAQAIAALIGRGGDELTFGTVPVSKIAAQVGTPFFAYAGDALVARLRRVKAALGNETELYFSLKANASLGLCQLVPREGIGAELASISELLLAQKAGFAASKAIFAGPGKTDHELREAVAWGIESVNVESKGELLRLADFHGAAVEGDAVHAGHRCLGSLIVSHRHEAEAARAVGLTILDHLGVRDHSEALKR